MGSVVLETTTTVNNFLHKSALFLKYEGEASTAISTPLREYTLGPL